MVVGRYVSTSADPLPPEPSSLPAGAAQSPAPAQSPSVVDALLCQAANACGPYSCGEAACGESTQCCTAPDGYCCPWYGSAYALVMGRNSGNRVWTSYDWADESDQVEHTAFGLKWRWGGEITIGRRFCCGTRALEITYWTLDAFEGSRTTSLETGVATPLTVGHLSFDGSPATDWFDGALEHRLRRRDEVQSVEVNLVRQRLLSGSGLPLDIDILLGTRFFRFEDDLVFSALADPDEMTDPGQDHEAFLDEHITNELLGIQLGFDANYQLRSNWRMFITPKFGIYNNHIEHVFQAYLGDGTVATQSMYPTMSYPVRSDIDVVSFLTQVDLGLEWQFARNWSARLGYRAVVVTGVGLADNQIPPYIADIPEIAAIDTNGELVLHGAFFGLAYNY
jgi:hypothetical protein